MEETWLPAGPIDGIPAGRVKLIEFGDTTQIFTNPHEQRTRDYITGRYG